MNTLQSFSYENNEVRTIMIDGEPWFVLRDVCQALRISHVKDTADRLDPDEVGQAEVIDSLGRKQTVTIINESGLYAVILRSDKPEAKPFRKWVTAEVLPRIRKDGGYIAGVSSSEELLAKALLAAQRALEGQTARIAELEAENVGLMAGNARNINPWNDEEFQRLLTCALTAGREDYITILYLARFAGLSLLVHGVHEIHGFLRLAKIVYHPYVNAEGEHMKQVICPIDKKPCERDCPDRYHDRPGCMLTTAQELGAKILDFGGGNIGMLFSPGGC